ncbi:hypothetical protein HX109_09740 [Galbibacter sp. BG1]|uniref:sialate O-acetylesterase n=1 Tax=Galbibacter sp. BG1 TaxID=1170699 RepID=UPI0015BBC6DB|nr:sialate O-acetylesterase [Galbibacter sp. BG1]QLE01825.1 hypothetical protein HX109_09740 [Galbibacter sp. BG1]
MVLQQKNDVEIWGWANPKKEIEIRVGWNDSVYKVTTDNGGKWRAFVTTTSHGGPYEITIEADTLIKLNNVMLGEVWLCSGQSNMEWSLENAESGAEELRKADYSNIRLFQVEKAVAPYPLKDVNGTWQLCNPENVKQFSAVGYFFGKQLYENLNIPVGLIHSSWGGTPAEAWVSKETLLTMKDFDKQLKDTLIPKEKLDIQEIYKRKDSLKLLEPALLDYNNQANIGVKNNWKSPSFNDSEWIAAKCPSEWTALEEIGEVEGVVWMRKKVEIPKSWVGKELTLELGPIDEMDATYVNGNLVGKHINIDDWQKERSYKVPTEYNKKTSLQIAIRVANSRAQGGIYGHEHQLRLYPSDTKVKPISLAGLWRYKIASRLPRIGINGDQNYPSFLYNAMIHPLLHYKIRGVVWYQGESNASRAYQYRTLFPNLISDWRHQWKEEKMPFYFVQIAPFNYGMNPVGVELREAQLLTMKNVPYTGMAVISDIGNFKDIHPKNKRDVGERLSRWALNKTYRKDLVPSGPIYRDYTIENDKIVVSFDYVGDGLIGRDGKLENFEIAGSDHKFYKANAFILKDQVVVSSKEVKNPVAVRYAWQNTVDPNLFNKQGLPASSFSTEDWERATK